MKWSDNKDDILKGVRGRAVPEGAGALLGTALLTLLPAFARGTW